MSAALTTQRFSHEAKRDLSPDRFSESLSGNEYAAGLWFRWESFEAIVDSIAIALNAHKWPSRVTFQLRLRTKAKVTVNSPERGVRRSDDWGTQFGPDNVVNGLFAFGQQIAAVLANGGLIKSVTLDIILPPPRRRVINWKVV